LAVTLSLLAGSPESRREMTEKSSWLIIWDLEGTVYNGGLRDL
jgi:hypothetical protein